MTEQNSSRHQHRTAVIDNGSFGTREITFSTGRLARQAAGSVIVQLGETVVLSATTAGKQPKEHFDFFPLTVDVEERMYAAGRIPGSFFRREGRPSEDAILTCRLIDRPLRPSFTKGLRNEVQVVETILALDPQHPYDVVAMNAASMSTKLSGLPFSGPVGATRVAHIEGQWVAFPTLEELERATFDMVVAGRVLADGDVAIMMVEAEATPHAIEADPGRRRRADRGGRRQRAGGRQAGHPRAVPRAERAGRGRREAGRRVPGLPGLPGRRLHGRRRRRPWRGRRGAEDRRQGRARGGPGPGQGQGARGGRPAVRGPGEGDQRGVPLADQVRGARPRAARAGPHRRPRPA